MKHKLQTSHRETNLKENEKRRQIRTNANALVQGLRRRSPSHENKKLEEINLQMLLVEKQVQTIYQMKSQYQLRKKIQFLNLNKGKRTRAKSPTRSHSKTDYTQKTNKQNNK